MFDIGWSELLLIAVVALIAIGPKELPGALRTFGQWMGKVRRMAGEFQNQFHEAMREAELADLKKEVDEMSAKAAGYADFDPIGDVRRDIEKNIGDLPSLDALAQATGSAPPEAPAGEAAPVAQAEADAAAAAVGSDSASAPPKPEAAALPAAEPQVDTAAKPEAGRAPA
jgi:sec-independent protein translocase protein TatB